MIECVPNISEGRNPALLDTLSGAIRAVPLLDRSSDHDHNRTVFTFAGEAEAVLEAALELAEAAFSNLTLTGHSGVHPRIGVLDVLPFVPMAGSALGDCITLAHRAAAAIWERWRVPSYFYEAAGSRPLERVRREGGPFDTGTALHPTAGAVAIGARKFLVAWNIWLATTDLALAKRIAKQIRVLPCVKALGLPLASRNVVQVSINSTDFETTPLQLVFDAVAALAREAGVQVLGSELIGLIPEQALSPGLPWLNWHQGLVLERALQLKSVSHS